MSARFDRIFGCKTGFATRDRLLARLRANTSELLKVLERPDIPLNTNGSENDIRCQGAKRKISGGTRSDAGRDGRDAFLGLDLRQARHRLLRLPRRTPRCPRPPGNPRPRRNRQRTRPQAPLIARTFAPVTRTRGSRRLHADWEGAVKAMANQQIKAGFGRTTGPTRPLVGLVSVQKLVFWLVELGCIGG